MLIVNIIGLEGSLSFLGVSSLFFEEFGSSILPPSPLFYGSASESGVSVCVPAYCSAHFDCVDFSILPSMVLLMVSLSAERLEFYKTMDGQIESIYLNPWVGILGGFPLCASPLQEVYYSFVHCAFTVFLYVYTPVCY